MAEWQITNGREHPVTGQCREACGLSEGPKPRYTGRSSAEQIDGIREHPAHDHRAVSSRNDAGPSLRLVFDAGTLIVEGLAEGDEPGLPGVKYDHATKVFRAEAIWYRSLVEHIRSRKSLTPTGAGL